MQRTKHRTIWISDVHLGTRGCQHERLAHFLKHNECETLYLVGDIIDGWRLNGAWYWPQAHNNLVKQILGLAKHGTKVVYIPGNHDEFLRDYLKVSDMTLGNVSIQQEAVHITADGRRLWVIHGDEFDGITKYHKWLAVLGDHAYSLLLYLNRHFNSARTLMGLKYWSLSQYLKHKVKSAVSFISQFEHAIGLECRRAGYDGVVCGHIHHAEARLLDTGIWYYNSGDWVESCTAIVEDRDGTLKTLHWSKK